MKILFIAPLPPPVTGQSLASYVFLKELQKSNTVYVINFNKSTFKQGVSSFGRIIEVIKILQAIWFQSKNVDAIYLTVSQSIAGNIKDLLTYLLCFNNIHKMVIHLHGGGIKKLIFDKYKLLRNINTFFLRRLGGAVVLGRSLIPIFESMVPEEKIYVVPNFAEDYLFLNEKEIKKIFKNLKPLRILFLSNLIPGKGHEELVDAYKALSESQKEKVNIGFAGGFESNAGRRIFLNKIDGVKGIKYHGIVFGAQKRELFSKAHIFCLPTYYPYEGQPISILEAYASGCAVITTDQGGICDIFKNGVNGFEVQKKSAISIETTINQIMKRPERLIAIALTNSRIAYEKYTTAAYSSSLIKIIENIKKYSTRYKRNG